MNKKTPKIESTSVQFFGTFDLSLNGISYVSQDDMKLNAALAYLCFHPNEVISRDSLLTLFWPECDEGKARQNLRTLLSRLRRKFKPFTEQILQTTRQTVKLVLTKDTATDLERFDLFGEPSLSSLDSFIHMARTDFLANMQSLNSTNFEEWLLMQRMTFRRGSTNQLKRVLQKFEKEMTFQRSLDICFAILEHSPWDEDVHLKIMRLYHHNSMTTAAINQYELHRKSLKKELSVEPSEQLKQYYELLLTERHRDSNDISDESGVRAFEEFLNEGCFPTFSVPYVPVDAETKVFSFLKERKNHLVSLVGFGGIGKTRIACEVARRIKEDLGKDCFFLSYADFPDKTHATTKQLLLFTAEKLNQHLDYSMPLENQFFGFWKHREAFFVLDNFEAALQGSDFLQQWMGHSTGSQFLVTSRVPLELQAEEVVSVEGFLVSEEGKVDPSRVSSSVDFFLSNVPEGTLGTFEDLPEQKQRQLEQICLRLGGHPVALENVAFWLEHFSLDEVEERLQSIDTKDIYSLSQNTKELFDYSWELLFSEQKHVLFQLSLLQGFFGSSLAQQLTKSSSFVLNSVTKSGWLKRSVHSDQYYFHDLFRQYISEKLEENEEEKNKCIQRFCSYFLEELFEEHKDKSSRHQDILPIIEHHWVPFLHAIEFVSQGEKSDTLYPSLMRLYAYVEASYRTHELESLLPSIQSNLEKEATVSPELREAIFLLNLLRMRRNRQVQHEHFLEVMASQNPRELSLQGQVDYFYYKSFLLILEGNQGKEAWNCLNRAEKLSRELSSEYQGVAKVRKAEYLAFQQKFDEAGEILHEAHSMLKEAKSSYWLSLANLSFGHIAMNEGRFLEAESHLQQFILHSQVIVNPVSKNLYQMWMGQLSLSQQKLREARLHLEHTYENYRIFGNDKYQGYAQYLLACLDYKEGNATFSERLSEALQCAKQEPLFFPLLAAITTLLGRHLLNEGKLEEAVGYFWQSLCLHARKRGRDPSDSFVLLAQLLHAYGHDEESFQVLSYLYSQEDFVQNPIFSDEIKDFAKQMFRCFANEEKQPLLDEMGSWTEHHLVEKALFLLPPWLDENAKQCPSCLFFSGEK